MRNTLFSDIISNLPLAMTEHRPTDLKKCSNNAISYYLVHKGCLLCKHQEVDIRFRSAKFLKYFVQAILYEEFKD